jgi:hypothetical protein
MGTMVKNTAKGTVIRIPPVNPLVLEISTNDGIDWTPVKTSKKIGEFKNIEPFRKKGSNKPIEYMVATNSAGKQFYTRDSGKHWCGNFLLFLRLFGILNGKLARRIFG